MADDAAFHGAAIWSDARVEQLKLHHAMGLSAALSADLIGGVSRNAVISKRRRLGLVGANPLQAAMRRARRAARICAGDGLFRLGGPGDLRCEPLPDMDWPPPPDANPRTLADKNAGECAWPLGCAEDAADYQTLFCCAPTGRGESYCPDHRQRAYAGPPQTSPSPKARR